MAVQNGAGGTTKVNNAGLILADSIVGVTQPRADKGAIAIYGGSQVEFVNEVTGNIHGRVALQAPGVPGTGNSFTNAGTIAGSVSLGEGGNNTFTAVTGSMVTADTGTASAMPVLGIPGLSFAKTGTVYAGGVNNTLVLQNVVTGTGAGSSAMGSVSANTYQNFQNLRVNSGTWGLADGQLVSGGTVELNGGTLKVSGSTQLGSGAIDARGGTLSTSISSLVLSNNFSLGGGGLTLSGGNAITLNGVLSGVGGLKITGTSVTLTGPSLYAGGTVVASDATLAGNTDSLQGSITNNGSVTFNQFSNGTYSGAMSGTGTLVKAGAGTLTLIGSNTGNGGTSVVAGTLAVRPGGLSSGALNMSAGTLLDLTQADDQTLAALSGGGTIELGANTLTVDSNLFTTYLGDIAGTGQLVKQGTGELILSGNSNLQGGVTVNGGSLAVNTTSTPSLAATVNAGGTLNLSLRSLQRLGWLNGGGGEVKLGASTLLLASGNYAGAISGAGGRLDKQGTGTLTLNGINTYTGGTQVTGGSLLVGDSSHATARVDGPVSVSSGASLGGFGTVAGDVDVASGGHLAPGAPGGVFTIAGNLGMQQGSQADFSLGAPAGYSTPGAGHGVSVSGDLSLQGAQLNVLDAGGFGPGLYRLFDWGGTLTMGNGGLVSQPGQTLQVLTTNKQINLINSANLTLNFWNANGLASASQMGGGSGVWSQTAPNWTDAAGSLTSIRTPSDAFAIFGGAAGTVSVDDSAGAVAAQGIQFASDGYRLNGADLALTGTTPGALGELRVGDGSQVSSAWTATIDNRLTGAGIDKTGLGTLVLNGSNQYTQSTRLSLGSLSVSSDANLGAASANLDFQGGTLRVTGSGFQSTARNVLFGSAGGGIDIAEASNTFTLGQQLSGSGSLTKLGDGTLVLGGNNSYSGGTLISAGALSGSAGSFGSGEIVDNAKLILDQASDASFANVISGSGSLTKAGAGNLTLGSNHYSGGTQISAGTLTGSAESFGSGAIINDAHLVLEQASDASFANALSGSGSLVKRGAGVLALESISSVGGGTQVEAGRLVVGGSAGSSARLSSNVEVAGGATLGGHGVIDGNVSLASGARLAPGNSIGTLTVDGDVTLGAGSTLEIESAPDGSTDRLVSTGTVTLDGANLNVLAEAGTWKPSSSYDIVQAAALQGSFADVTSNLVFLDASVTYSATGATLVMERNDTTFVSVAETANQRAVASVIDPAVGKALWTDISGLSAEQARRAYDSLSGELHASARTALFDDSRQVRESITDRLYETRQGKAGTDLDVWVKGYGGSSGSDSTDGAASLDRSSQGMLVGADLPVNDTWRAGLAVGYGTGDLDVDARSSSADVSSTTLAAYLGGQWDALGLRLGAARTWNDLDSRRDVTVGSQKQKLKASYDADTTQVFAELGYRLRLAELELEPFAGIAHVEVHSESFNEHGGAAALHGDSETDRVDYTTLGLRAKAPLGSLFDRPLALTTSLAWQHALDVPEDESRMTLGDYGSFTVSGVPLARDTAVGRIGVSLQVAPQASVELGYSGQTGDGSRDNAARLGLNIAF
ncbi:autotransporter domain-containing protein [Pseudomonas nicosulfuronedens]